MNITPEEQRELSDALIEALLEEIVDPQERADLLEGYNMALWRDAKEQST